MRSNCTFFVNVFFLFVFFFDFKISRRHLNAKIAQNNRNEVPKQSKRPSVLSDSQLTNKAQFGRADLRSRIADLHIYAMHLAEEV